MQIYNKLLQICARCRLCSAQHRTQQTPWAIGQCLRVSAELFSIVQLVIALPPLQVFKYHLKTHLFSSFP